MVYDNTKLDLAFRAWMEQNVELGFGEIYSGDLLDDFCEFLDETKMLKRSPGRVVFGKYLDALGVLEKRKKVGLTYWSGLKLKKPRTMKPKRYQRTIDAEQLEDQKRRILQLEKQMSTSPEARKERLEIFQDELASETEEQIRSIEPNDDL